MLFRLHFLLHCICFLYNQFLFSFLHFILCRMCVCHMFNKVLTYLLPSSENPLKYALRRGCCFKTCVAMKFVDDDDDDDVLVFM